MQLSPFNKQTFYEYGITSSRILYMTGVQSVRICKRIWRRTIRFFSPIAELIRLIYAKTIGKQLIRLKKRDSHFFRKFSARWGTLKRA